MNTTYGLDMYRSHDLNIAMRTSSGDVIKFDFANRQSASMQSLKDENGSSTSMSFSSMQSFEFSIESNGISQQDQKEIDKFMEMAQPYIDDFLKELSEDAPKSPVTKLAHDIAGLFDPNRERSSDAKDGVKANIVKMFDNSIANFEPPQAMTTEEMIKKILEDTQNLLEKTLKEFDAFNKVTYA